MGALIAAALERSRASLLLLGLARRNRKPAAALPDRDPWDRLSERLR